MIKVNMHNVEIEGDRAQLCAEVTLVLQRLFKDNIIDKHDLAQMVELSQLSFEELEKRALSSMILSTLIDACEKGDKMAKSILDDLMEEVEKDLKKESDKDSK